MVNRRSGKLKPLDRAIQSREPTFLREIMMLEFDVVTIKEFQLTNEQITEILKHCVPPILVTEESIRAYRLAYMAGGTKAIRLCLKDLIKRDLGELVGTRTA